jgi:hypothetical protein
MTAPSEETSPSSPPDQPPLPEVDVALRPFVGASKRHRRLFEFGGIVRKTVPS